MTDKNKTTTDYEALLHELLRAAKDARSKQKLYFKTTYGTPEKALALEASKESERKLDKLLKDIEITAKQGRLL